MAYSRFYPTWFAKPNPTTPLRAATMQHIEDGIVAAALAPLDDIRATAAYRAGAAAELIRRAVGDLGGGAHG